MGAHISRYAEGLRRRMGAVPRKSDRRYDEHDVFVCLAFADGYVMCRYSYCLPVVKNLKEWQALSSYPLKVEQLTNFQCRVLELMDRGLHRSREIADELRANETRVSEAMDYLDAFKKNLMSYALKL